MCGAAPGRVGGEGAPPPPPLATLALVEDDAFHAELYSGWLHDAGYRVLRYASGAEFRRRLDPAKADLVVLDWHLPDANGLELLRWLREVPRLDLPVLFLTGNDAEQSVVDALRAGASDYVIKPPRPQELVARIAGLLRHARRDGTEPVPLMPPYEIDPAIRSILLDGQPVKITEREFLLLWFLLQRQGRIVGRDVLLGEIWRTSTEVSTRTIDTHVYRLRRKLGLDGRHGWRLVAVYQSGYRLDRVDPEAGAEAGDR